MRATSKKICEEKCEELKLCNCLFGLILFYSLRLKTKKKRKKGKGNRATSLRLHSKRKGKKKISNDLCFDNSCQRKEKNMKKKDVQIKKISIIQ